MTLKSTLNSKLFIFGIPLFLILSSVFFAFKINTLSANQGIMSMALTVDLVITIPFIYFLLIRKSTLSNFTVMPFFVAGLIIASIVIPSTNQYTLDLIKTWFLPLVEIAVISAVFIKIRKVRGTLKANKLIDSQENAIHKDFVTLFKKGAQEILPPKLASALATEIGLIYYCFVTWKKPQYDENEFSYHKESGAQLILGVLLGVATIELFSVHLLLENSYPILSWILSGISLYGVIQIFGLMKSLPRRPVYLTENALVIRMGLIQETHIPFEKITAVELTMADYPKADKSYQRMTLFDHNCILHLNEPEIMVGLFGSKKNYKHLVLSIDDKARFKGVVAAKLNSTHEI